MLTSVCLLVEFVLTQRFTIFSLDSFAVENPKHHSEPARNHLASRVNRALTEVSAGRTGIKHTTVETHAIGSDFVTRATSPSGRRLDKKGNGCSSDVGSSSTINIDEELKSIRSETRSRRSTIGDHVAGFLQFGGGGEKKSKRREKRLSITIDGAEFTNEELKEMPQHLRPEGATVVLEIENTEKEDLLNSVRVFSGSTTIKRGSVKDRVNFINQKTRTSNFKQNNLRRASMLRIEGIPGARVTEDRSEDIGEESFLEEEDDTAAQDLDDQLNRDSFVPDAAEALPTQSIELLKEWGANKDEHKRDNTESNTGDLHQCRCQVVRSYSSWTAGLAETEDGIHDAYKQLIEGAQHYIYIENQFFISACGEKDSVIQNTIANALFSRIMNAHSNGEAFRVYVVLPLVPGMTGAIKTDGMSGIACVMYFQYRTICHGGESLFERLQKHGVDGHKFFFFAGLRKYQEFDNSMETEMVYIHSKLMIVDDRKAIIGSANINDRSMVGYKDSEIAIIVEDTLKVDGTMGGKPFKAGPFCRGLRLKCWFDNLGLQPSEWKTIEDPKCEETWNFVCGRAKNNTKLYERAFPGITPTNQISSFRAWAASDKASNNAMAEDVNGGEDEHNSKDSKDSARMNVSGKDNTVMSHAELGMKRGLMKSQSIRFHNKKTLLDQEEERDVDGSSFSGNNPMLEGKKGAEHHQRTSSCVEARSILNNIKGIITEFPLDFLKDDYSRMKSTIVPSEIFK